MCLSYLLLHFVAVLRLLMLNACVTYSPDGADRRALRSVRSARNLFALFSAFALPLRSLPFVCFSPLPDPLCARRAMFALPQQMHGFVHGSFQLLPDVGNKHNCANSMLDMRTMWFDRCVFIFVRCLWAPRMGCFKPRICASSCGTTHIVDGWAHSIVCLILHICADRHHEMRAGSTTSTLFVCANANANDFPSTNHL